MPNKHHICSRIRTPVRTYMPGKCCGTSCTICRVTGMPVVVSASIRRCRSRQFCEHVRHNTAYFVPETAYKNKSHPLPVLSQRLLGNRLALLPGDDNARRLLSNARCAARKK